MLCKDFVKCCIVDITLALTFIFGPAAGVHGVSGWLLCSGTTAPASDCWLWGAFVLFSFLNVSVDTWGLAGTERRPGEGQREQGSLAGDDSAALVIWWHSGRTEQNSLEAQWVMIFFPNSFDKKYSMSFFLFFCWITRVASPSLVGDWPLPCPASCGLPAVGRRFSCIPPSAPSSSLLGHSLPFRWHIASPHHIEPNAPLPRRARDWKK